MNRKVYFLGAGVSTLVGVPTFSNFYDKALSIYLDKSFSPNDESERFRNVLEHWMKFYKDYTIEEYYSTIEMNDMLSQDVVHESEIDQWEINENGIFSIKTATKFRINADDVARVIYATINDIIKDPIRSNIKDASKYYRTFLDFIDYTKSSIITTNWDIVFEFFIPRYHIDYINAYSYDLQGKISNIDTFKILKLNGSLNWGYCHECNRIYHFHLYSFDELETRKCNICKTGDLKRVIVPPTLSKLVNIEDRKDTRSQLVPIWKEANDRLRYCDEIYFIGYSFPDTDVQTRIFILDALRHNQNLKKIVIVTNQKYGNSKIEFEERYLRIFSKLHNRPNIYFDYKGFNCFCNSLSKDPIDEDCR